MQTKQKEKVEIIIEDNKVIIGGLELRPYYKRLILALFWWKNPRFILTNPKIFFNRKSKGELIALFG